MIRRFIENIYEYFVSRQCLHIPHHIAIIQDGNRRFARKKGIATASGHRAGADRTEEVLEWAQELGIRHITLYTFSTENFNRTDEEVQNLFQLFKEKLSRICLDERVHKYGIRIQMIGDREMLPDNLRDAVEQAETATAHYDNFYLNMALAYGGRNEMLRTTAKILDDVREKKITKDEITPELFEENLYGNNVTIPPVDLIIRTGNEYRTSNFLPWLANGHESAVYFCAPYWPMFRKIDMLRAIRVYSERQEMKKKVSC
ncbi:MAG TPA: polyprenyl diphosphate synthase [Methanospirillum sp.]|jgi:tritrans,polycis-undecaprenyl-diphosphate synthase [geranylgeranyl-diphosphate specific]|uniref:polyprenyl diphosphate synthase n=1 Tax=Methanospirillum sp. TaxID=45200 RepID=UPI001BD2DA78|nr:polyprenyl diphosphate synthase [Methanospirillum sp.]MCZ2416301.1 di-trans,poly-cis-decaprenylcistransferase [Burkholderiales bacterium]HPY60946.1 polyprenyl diphosphate synthase [Methanospirillum sp.]HQB99119.1 polyprenyl diphosphate synthase [Methanospirillum sp.]